MERRYSALRVIATVMKILGVIVGILIILAVCGLLTTGFQIGAEFDRLLGNFGQNQGGWGAIIGLAGGLLASLSPIIMGGSISIILFAGGEAIYVQIDIEENTRATNWYLEQQTISPTPGLQQSQQNLPDYATANTHPRIHKGRIDRIKAMGDTEMLAGIIENDKDWLIALDAAEALAQLGDKRGRAYLESALNSDGNAEREIAQEILDGLQ